jgi:hypothetical protein
MMAFTTKGRLSPLLESIRSPDPTVLLIYLTTCWPKELETIFGPVDCFLVEGEDAGDIIEFRRKGDLLLSNPIPLETVPA